MTRGGGAALVGGGSDGASIRGWNGDGVGDSDGNGDGAIGIPVFVELIVGGGGGRLGGGGPDGGRTGGAGTGDGPGGCGIDGGGTVIPAGGGGVASGNVCPIAARTERTTALARSAFAPPPTVCGFKRFAGAIALAPTVFGSCRLRN